MALHFPPEEFDARRAALTTALDERRLDGLLMFAQESMYWLTGYDTFGYCFFQCLVVTADGRIALLTRAPDLRQAQHTSNIEDIRIWVDRGASDPATQLRDLLDEFGLGGARLGIEYDTHGLTAANGRAVDAALSDFATLEDASNVVPRLRVVKSPAEIRYVRRAAALADAAWARAATLIAAGTDEGAILAEMQGEIFRGGGDYPGNEFIIGSADDALLCRYKSGRRRLTAEDQITLEFAGSYRHYHAAMMRTAIVGRPSDRHIALYDAAREALVACEEALRPGHRFADVFDAHARIFDARGLAAHRLNACGYSLGARFSPSWMDWPMFHAGNTIAIEPDMTLFLHMILADSDTGTAMTLGRTYLTTATAPESLSQAALDLVVN